MRAARFRWILVPLLAVLLIAAGRQGAEMAALNVLRFGDRGPEVAALQQALRSAGYSPGVVDGVYGPRTEEAVRRAQADFGVTVDGLAGPVTMARLMEAAGPEQETVRLVVHKAAPVKATAAEVAATAAPGADSRLVGEVRDLALTFNGTPEPEQLPKVLALLREHGMKATFFLHGEAAEQQPELVTAIAVAGHELGTLGYADLDMTLLTEHMQIAQIRRSVQAIRDAVGAAPLFFRPPQGRFNTQLFRAAAAEGLQPVLWTNVAMAPAPHTPAERISDELLESAYPGAVLMLPQNHPAAVEALSLLLPRLEAAGYRSVGLSALLSATEERPN